MVQGILKWIAEQVLEGKSLVNIDFGETGLNSGEKMALIDCVLVAGVRDFGRHWRPCHSLRLSRGPYPSRSRPSRVAA